VRSLLAICTAFFCVANLPAQQQESSLVDRLLRPNMELQNPAQEKKFAASSTVVERRGTVGTFYLQPNRTEKSFADERSYSAQKYNSGAFNSGVGAVDAAQNKSANKPARVGSSGVWDVRAAQEHGTIATRPYAEEQHQFREQGKSQKSLDRQNPPLTIDQVRELLNKNK